MLYLIGLGLNLNGISKEGLSAIDKCDKVYLEAYTVEFPYTLEQLSENLGKKIEKLDRNEVESDRLVKEAKKQNIALLVYGCPLFATTHQTILEDASKQKVKIKVIYAASVFDAIAETGLQLYKFGKVTSMPAWKKNFSPDSFLEIVKENQSIKAHSLILVDIGLGFSDALNQLKISLKNKKMNFDKIVICSNLGGENSKIIYSFLESLEKNKKISAPYCFIIPAELHFVEKEALSRFE